MYDDFFDLCRPWKEQTRADGVYYRYLESKSHVRTFGSRQHILPQVVFMPITIPPSLRDGGFQGTM